MMSASYTIEEYLQGLFDFDIPSSAFKSILYKRDVESGTQMESLKTPEGVKKTELCEADLCMWLARSSSSSRGEYESDGGWQHQKATKNVTDRSGLISRANAIYAKYGEAVSDNGKIIIRDV